MKVKVSSEHKREQACSDVMDLNPQRALEHTRKLRMPPCGEKQAGCMVVIMFICCKAHALVDRVMVIQAVCLRTVCHWATAF